MIKFFEDVKGQLIRQLERPIIINQGIYLTPVAGPVANLIKPS